MRQWLTTPACLGADDWKRPETTEDDARLPLERTFGAGSQSQLWQASSDHGQDDLCLQFCEGSAQAKVNAIAERELPVLGPANVEPVGIEELVRVTIGRAKDGGDVLSSRQCDAANAELLGHLPARELHRAVEAQELSDGSCYQAGIRAKTLKLLGMAQ